MHALTARMTRLHMGKAAVSEAVVAAADALMELWGTVENDPRRNLDLRGHAIWLDRLRGEALASSGGVHPVLIRLGWSLGESVRIAPRATSSGSLTELSQYLAAVIRRSKRCCTPAGSGIARKGRSRGPSVN
jgi:hypothetical protein